MPVSSSFKLRRQCTYFADDAREGRTGDGIKPDIAETRMWTEKGCQWRRRRWHNQ
jgi:hypothetical protein